MQLRGQALAQVHGVPVLLTTTTLCSMYFGLLPWSLERDTQADRETLKTFLSPLVNISVSHLCEQIMPAYIIGASDFTLYLLTISLTSAPAVRSHCSALAQPPPEFRELSSQPEVN